MEFNRLLMVDFVDPEDNTGDGGKPAFIWGVNGSVVCLCCIGILAANGNRHLC